MKKSFDAVAYMRKTRDSMSEKYLKHPKVEERDLVRIRKKYNGFKRTGPKRQHTVGRDH